MCRTKQECLNNCTYPHGLCNNATGECDCRMTYNPYNSSRPWRVWGGEDCSYLPAFAGANSRSDSPQAWQLLATLATALLLAAGAVCCGDSSSSSSSSSASSSSSGASSSSSGTSGSTCGNSASVSDICDGVSYGVRHSGSSSACKCEGCTGNATCARVQQRCVTQCSSGHHASSATTATITARCANYKLQQQQQQQQPSRNDVKAAVPCALSDSSGRQSLCAQAPVARCQ
jgi:hypothetical protein